MEPVDCYLRLIELLKEEVKLVSGDLKRSAGKDDDAQLLMTIPGVGYYVALLVKSEIGDIRRFSSGDHLASYVGLVPSTRSSGGVERYGGITREGSRWLRWAMVEAAMVHVRYDTPVTRSTTVSLRGVAGGLLLWLLLGSLLRFASRCWCMVGRTSTRWMLRPRYVSL
jgi:transposase